MFQSFEQFHAQLVFELTYLQIQRRLRNVEFLRGTREMKFLSNR